MVDPQKKKKYSPSFVSSEAHKREYHSNIVALLLGLKNQKCFFNENLITNGTLLTRDGCPIEVDNQGQGKLE